MLMSINCITLHTIRRLDAVFIRMTTSPKAAFIKLRSYSGFVRCGLKIKPHMDLKPEGRKRHDIDFAFKSEALSDENAFFWDGFLAFSVG